MSSLQAAVDDAATAIKRSINFLGLCIGSPDIYPDAIPPASAGDGAATGAGRSALDGVRDAVEGIGGLVGDMIGHPDVPPYVEPGLSVPGAEVAAYRGLVTSEHADKPLFAGVMTALLQPLADQQALLGGLADRFDLDRAVGDQLDTIGLWVGVRRNVSVPLTGVYFSLDTDGVGFDQGVWWQSGDPPDRLVTLPDDGYRTLIRAKIAANNWDGTVPGAYAVWSTVFAGTGYSALIQDNQDMTMEFALLGPLPDAVMRALFEGGYLNVRPAGVAVNNYWTPTVTNNPYFGFDVENSSITGFDTGSWGKPTAA